MTIGIIVVAAITAMARIAAAFGMRVVVVNSTLELATMRAVTAATANGMTTAAACATMRACRLQSFDRRVPDAR